MKCAFWILFALLLPCCCDRTQADTAPLPDLLKLSMLDGSPVRLTCAPGRLLAVNLWTTWCGPCKKEIEILKQIQPELQAQQCDIVGIVLDAAPPAYLRTTIQQLKIPYPVYIGSTGSALAFFSVTAVPATIIVDSHAMILHRLTGARSADELRRVVHACRTAQPLNNTQ